MLQLQIYVLHTSNHNKHKRHTHYIRPRKQSDAATKPSINTSEALLIRAQRHTLTQHRSTKSLFLPSYKQSR